MNEANAAFDLNEEKPFIFTAEVPDETLERAAYSGANAGALTIAMCTGQSECPYSAGVNNAAAQSDEL